MKKFGFLSHLDLNLYLFRSPIMKELIKRGHKVYAICPKGDKNQGLSDIGCEVINYDIDRKALNPIDEKKSIANIYLAIKDLNLDVLHTFTAKPNIYGTFAARKAGVPVVLNLVEGLGSFYVKNTLKNILIRTIMEKLYKRAFQLSNGCIFVNNDDPIYMIQKKIIKQEKVKIIKSVGVDTEKFNIQNYSDDDISLLKEKNNLTGKVIVLMVARAIWDKGIQEYYKAAALLKPLYSDVIFILAGGTDEGNPSCANRQFLNSGAVRWLGHRDDIADLTAISDIYVLPSYREGLPATLMEAASMSKPIITTNTVGCREVVDDNVNGFLVPIRDAKILADKIERLIQHKNLRISMGIEGRKKALEEFEINKIVHQYMEFYETFI